MVMNDRTKEYSESFGQLNGTDDDADLRLNIKAEAYKMYRIGTYKSARFV